MTMLVFSTFASDNGVFQAGLGLTVILAVLASQGLSRQGLSGLPHGVSNKAT